MIKDVANSKKEEELVHLSWSHMGTELAIVDVFGRISIYTVTPLPSIDRLFSMRTCTFDPVDDLNAVVGMIWLYSDKQVCAGMIYFDNGQYN